ncbi:MAG TPA: thermonuclease family protein [Burkholderiales bacterium]
MTQIHDGDSLRLSDRRDVRLIGVNAPEMGRDGAPDQPLAVAARDRVDALVRGRSVQLRYDIERVDRHGRTLAYVYLSDGRDLQEILLRDGLAWFVAIAPNVAHRDRYRSAEAQARAARRGLWSLPDSEPVPAERLTRSDTGFRRIVGTVARVENRRDGDVLRLTPKVELTVPRGIPGFASSSLAGRRVVARGWLTAYKNGLRMRITDPTMLETPP